MVVNLTAGIDSGGLLFGVDVPTNFDFMKKISLLDQNRNIRIEFGQALADILLVVESGRLHIIAAGEEPLALVAEKNRRGSGYSWHMEASHLPVEGGYRSRTGLSGTDLVSVDPTYDSCVGVRSYRVDTTWENSWWRGSIELYLPFERGKFKEALLNNPIVYIVDEVIHSMSIWDLPEVLDDVVNRRTPMLEAANTQEYEIEYFDVERVVSGDLDGCNATIKVVVNNYREGHGRLGFNLLRFTNLSLANDGRPDRIAAKYEVVFSSDNALIYQVPVSWMAEDVFLVERQGRIVEIQYELEMALVVATPEEPEEDWYVGRSAGYWTLYKVYADEVYEYHTDFDSTSPTPAWEVLRAGKRGILTKIASDRVKLSIPEAIEVLKEANPTIEVADSIAVGNCVGGTNSFVKERSLPEAIKFNDLAAREDFDMMLGNPNFRRVLVGVAARVSTAQDM